MPFNDDKITAVLVFLERRKTRQLVGRLYYEKDAFVFEYDEIYIYSKNIISLGPEFPLTKRRFQSKELFTAFTDRLPSRENPAYPEYCAATGIDVDEKDPFILLTTIGHRGPSSFIFEPEYLIKFDSNDLKEFREQLGLSTRDFAACFEFTQAAITRVETRKSSGRELLKRAVIYARFPEVALDQIKRHGGTLHTDTRKVAEKILYEKLDGRSIKHY